MFILVSSLVHYFISSVEKRAKKRISLTDRRKEFRVSLFIFQLGLILYTLC